MLTLISKKQLAEISEMANSSSFKIKDCPFQT